MRTRLIAYGILSLCSLLSICSAQTMNLRVNGVQPEVVFREIKKQTGYVVIYPVASLRSTKPITIHLKKAPLTAILDRCVEGQPFRYAILDKTIVISDIKGELLPKVNLLRTVSIEGHVWINHLPQEGVSVKVKGTNQMVLTDTGGYFHLSGISPRDILQFSSINAESLEQSLNGRTSLDVVLLPKVAALDSVSVVVNSGYQYIPKEKATGSWILFKTDQIERSPATQLLDRLEGNTASVLFNKNIPSGVNQPLISIRGRSTIFANANPLIVLDRFAFDGDLSMINPDDVETITVLKDAAAASIWGAFSGNGVIVITTRKGHYKQPATLGFSMSVSVSGKPNLHYYPSLSSSDFMGIERFLYSNGHYLSVLQSQHLLVSPYVELLSRQSAGLLSTAQMNDAAATLKATDSKSEVEKYVLRSPVNQHYQLRFSGAANYTNYYLSGGYDRNMATTWSESYRRITFDSYISHLFFHQRVEAAFSVGYGNGLTTNQNTDLLGIMLHYPYLRLKDEHGNSAAVPNLFRQGYIDTAGQGSLLDWSYRPLDEMRYENNQGRVNDLHADGYVSARISKGWNMSLRYRNSTGILVQDDYYSLQTYFTRNLINTFSTIDPSSGAVQYGVPYGGVREQYSRSYHSHQGRLQSDYAAGWKNHSLVVISGTEIKSLATEQEQFIKYGYDANFHQPAAVVYGTNLPVYYDPSDYGTLTGDLKQVSTFTHFLSFYTNTNYSYDSKYYLSASIRRDASNLFGVNSNQQGRPFYSVGTAWDISREPFYHSGLFEKLKLRLSQGFNGNFYNLISALTTVNPSGNNLYGDPINALANPPNPSLRWEKSNIVNAGIDFSMGNGVLWGSLEWYHKYGTDLIGNSVPPPQSGVSTFISNSAQMKGWGIDITLSSSVSFTKLVWKSYFNLSYHTEQVSSYKVRQSSVGSYLNPSKLNPLEGFPVFSIYAYTWAGLGSTGNPRVISDGKISENYTAIVNSVNLSNLQFIGSAIPTWFGNWQHSVAYGPFAFSLNLSYKLGYYFRRQSLNYSLLFMGNANQPDYGLRWQKPGDETITHVPSMTYPASQLRDEVYQYSNILVEKADHIRLQDIRVSYEQRFGHSPVHSARYFLMVSNLGILWRANKYGIDPDHYSFGEYPSAMNIAVGCRVEI